MSFYEVILLVHIAAVIVWLGSGFLFHVLGHRAERSGNTVAMKQLLDDMAALANTVFIPASLIVLAAGIVLTIDGPWGFDQLWVLIALGGFAVTFAIGAGFLGPMGERLSAQMEADGGMTPQTLHQARRVLLIGRIDYVVLVLILSDMVLKPTGDDVGVLAAMAAVVIGGIALVMVRLRALDATPEPAVS